MSRKHIRRLEIKKKIDINSTRKNVEKYFLKENQGIDDLSITHNVEELKKDSRRGKEVK